MEYSELVEASRPDALLASWTAHLDDLRQAAGGHDHADLTSTRTETYKGHRIVVNTTYQITVDDRPFDTPVVVDNSGHVHYHGLPTREFVSTVDLVKRVIDVFPGDFDASTDENGGHHDHQGGH